MSASRRATVAHVSSAHPFTDNRIHYRECVSLSDAGFDVALIAVESPLEAPESPVRVVRMRRRQRLSRVLTAAPEAIYKALRSQARIVHLHDPELIPFIPVLRALGRKVVYDAHEDIPLQVLGKPYVRSWNRPLLVVIAKTLVALAKSADLVVAATDQIAGRFRPERTVVVRNYPPLRVEEEVEGERENIAVYVGGLARSRGLIELLDATEHPSFPADWSVHLAGPANSDVLEKIASLSKSGSDRVVFHGRLAPHAARDLLLRAKVGIVTLHPTPAYLESLPTKMFEYFAARLAVIASDFPYWRGIQGLTTAGLSVDPTSVDAVALAIRTYADDPELLKQHRDRGRALAVQTFNWGSEAETIVGAYERLMSR